MESSRLFVKNLPPSISEADFRKHFTTGGRQVTDVKVIPKRRIGYVGYKTVEEAAKAVKFFNRSYIRMSKISVEPARPISDSLPIPAKMRPATNKLPTPEPEPKAKANEDELNKKRKRDDLNESDPKLKEYLDVMRTGQANSSKLEGILDQPTAEKDFEMPVVPVEAESDDEYEEIPARNLKRQKGDAQEPILESTVVGIPSAEATPTAAAEDAIKTSQIADATDDDWLRSRTNRLLDLLDPDDPAALAPVVTRPTQQHADAAVPSLPTAMDVDQAPLDTEIPHQPSTGATDEENATDEIRRTARLFVRNLAFKATEAELRKHFKKYGEVDEVSSCLYFYFVLESVSSNVMSPR